MINEDGRDCPHCGNWKYWSQYHKNESGVMGHTSWCKMCNNKTQREAYHGRRAQSVADQVARIGEMEKERRFGALLALLEKLPQVKAREVFRRVEF